mgnify:FL=1
MPQIASFDGIELYMYFRDHAPPHVHAFYGDDEALVVVADGALFAGQLPARRLALVRAYIAPRRDELLNLWETFGGG